MSLTPGRRLGPYEITAPLGAGGMGEVWRARDTRLGRDVAVKVLPAGLGDDPERRARFEREARAVAALNHPHICVLHDIGREDGTDYLVLELVEGETLADRLKRGALPVSDTLRIGGEIADALDRAHRAGIVHRDLKPANVMLTRAGTKLMDFGLARAGGTTASGGSGSQLATLSRPVTAEGHIVGTFQYMSPEQLEGRDADPRADIWALGATLYEMATGVRAFEGATTASLIGAIMRDEPRPLAERAPATPPALERVIRTCLAKDPDQRWQSAGDVGRMLRNLDGASSASGAAVTAPPRRRAGREMLAWALAVLLPLAAFAFARFSTPARESGTVRTSLPLPRGVVYHFSGDFAGPPSLSPDGRRVAFVALDDQHGSAIWVRDLDQIEPHAVPGTEGGSFPFWSPDGRSLGFWSGASLKAADLTSGNVITVCPSLSMRGGTWGADGQIVFSPIVQDGLYRVSATGGRPELFTRRDTTFETTHRFPQFLPDGKHVLYFSGDHRARGSHRNGVWVASLDGRVQRQVLEATSSAVYSDGWMLFLRDSTLFAQRFDARALRLRGEPVALHERVQADGSTWTSNVSASQNGSLAYVLLGEAYGSRIEERARDGKLLRPLSPSLNHTVLYLGRDGRTLLEAGQDRPASDVFSIDIASGRRSRVVQAESDDDCPVMLPRANAALYMSNREAGGYRTFYQPLDGSSPARRLLGDAHSRDNFPFDVSPDERFALLGIGVGLSATWDSLVVVPLGGGPSRLLRTGQENFGDARISPDGRWLAYNEGPLASPQVFVAAFTPGWPEGAAPTGRWQANDAPATYPRWTQGGRELVFARPDGSVVAVSVETAGGNVRIGPERVLFRAPLHPQTGSLDVSPDGQRFYVNVLSGDDVSRLAIVTNWREGLARK